MTPQYNAAVAEKRAAEAGLVAIERPERLAPKEVRAMVDQLADVARALDCASRRELADLYDALRLAVDYDHRTRVATVTRSRLPRVWLVCVSEGGLEPPRPAKGTSTSS
jgi:site-specific DNA recombinase